MILFGFAYVEALLNFSIYKLQPEDPPEKMIRQANIDKKLDHIEELTSKQIPRKDIQKLQLDYKHLRDETVHFKSRDQSHQLMAQYIRPSEFIEIIQRFSIYIFCISDGCFPYWLLGWNYMGFNSIRELFLSNNDNGFGHTLSNMRFRFNPSTGPGMMNFSSCHMVSHEDFGRQKRFLHDFNGDAEPIHMYFPMRPRLVRRWWDPAVLKRVEDEVMQATG